jgi:hypothetical protein
MSNQQTNISNQTGQPSNTIDAEQNIQYEQSQKVSSDIYRNVSDSSRALSNVAWENATPLAAAYAMANDVSEEVARQAIDPDYETHRWERVQLQGEDSKVGDQIRSPKVQLVCNSLLNGRYNDTYATQNNPTMPQVPTSYVTYRSRHSVTMNHSGDQQTTYGLRHTIGLNKPDTIGSTVHILSASWTSGQCGPVALLTSTQPILEIRTEAHDGTLARYIIPQDFSQGGEMTASVNARATWDGEMWTVTIMQEFVRGFADDVSASIAGIAQLQTM